MRESILESLQADIDALGVVAMMALRLTARGVEPAISHALHETARITDFPEPVRRVPEDLADAFDKVALAQAPIIGAADPCTPEAPCGLVACSRCNPAGTGCATDPAAFGSSARYPS